LTTERDDDENKEVTELGAEVGSDYLPMKDGVRYSRIRTV
jgi:hypothetical protein